MSAALVVVAVPVSMAGLSPLIVPTSSTVVPHAVPWARVSASPLVPDVTHEPTPPAVLGHRADRGQATTEQTTIVGGLKLRPKKERNRKIAVSSSKGTRVWTASSLAEHDLPSAAMRAYKKAASTIDSTDPGCHLPWTLLAGIGRVESDHGRYGGSVLGNDGVPRPAIVGVALNGKGPVAAIHDTDHGSFDGDRVWDRAVGPMQFIPSTWLGGAERDGDGDGTMSPNDIDDAALAAAAYLCNAGGDLSGETAVKNAVLRYNPSDYYVALVTAFARGYQTGVFVIPSPDAPDAAAHAAQVKKAKAKAQARAARHALATARAKALARARASADAHALARQRARARAARLAAATAAHKAPTSTPTRAATSSGGSSGGTTSSPSPSPSPSPPEPPKLFTVTGVVTALDGGGWQVDGSLKVTAADLGDITLRDYDADGNPDGPETMAQEMDGLVASGSKVVISYYQEPSFKVTGFSLG